MLRPRLTLGAIILIGLLALPALALAGAINTTGSIDGDFLPQKPSAEAACNPGAPTTPEDNLCDSTSDGVVDLPTVIGIGTYTASMRFDHSIDATEPDCAVVTGTMVMTTATGTITFTILDTSRACLDLFFFDVDMNMAVASGTGAFAGMTGFLHASGGIGPSGGKGGPGFVMILTASGNIVAGVTPTATATTAPTATATAAPAVSLLPNAALPGTDASAGVVGGTVILLGTLLLVSSGAYLARRAGR